MRLAIADPPYLGRSVRYYGGGQGVKNGRGIGDVHPEAAEWDDEERHVQLVRDLTRDFDGWAIAMAADSLQVYMREAPRAARVMVWHKPNGMPGSGRVMSRWEPVLLLTPKSRIGLGHDELSVSDVLTQPATPNGFVGAKPVAWTRWVLGAMGYNPATDEVVDIFNGSGAVSYAVDSILL